MAQVPVARVIVEEYYMVHVLGIKLGL